MGGSESLLKVYQANVPFLGDFYAITSAEYEKPGCQNIIAEMFVGGPDFFDCLRVRFVHTPEAATIGGIGIEDMEQEARRQAEIRIDQHRFKIAQEQNLRDLIFGRTELRELKMGAFATSCSVTGVCDAFVVRALQKNPTNADLRAALETVLKVKDLFETA